ncbi:MAG: hypothetical protein ACRDY0_12605, partial [Acidimicrobiales bacterium]
MHPLVDPGELDQEQHDAVRDVFVAPSGVTLVRADLFVALGGFGPGVDQFGDDLDLCWRAHVAGARVVVAPTARARHLQAIATGRRAGWTSAEARRRARGLTDTHRLRAALTCYGLVSLAWIVPLACFYCVVEAAVQLAGGRFADAATTVASLGRAWARPAELYGARRRTQRQRRVSDGELGRLQSRGAVRLRAIVRAGLAGASAGPGPAVPAHEAPAHEAPAHEAPAHEAPAHEAPADEGPGEATAPAGDPPATTVWGAGGDAAPRAGPTAGSGSPPPGPGRPGGGWRLPTAVVVALGIVLLVGSRQLLGHPLPAVGRLPVTSGGVAHWWSLWWSGWRPDGLGSSAAAPPALGVLGVAGFALLGAAGTLQHVAVLGPLVVGPWGAWRVTRAFGSSRVRLAAVVVYAVNPLPYDALARGRWDGLLLYAAAPWLVGALAQAAGDAPFSRLSPARRRLSAIRLGLLLALVGAFVPAALVLVPVAGAALLAGAAAGGRRSAGLASLGLALTAAAVAAVLLLPWSGTTFTSVTSVFGVGGGPGARLGLGQILRFDTGPAGSGVLGWALLAAAALPLVIGGSWRLAWALRCWAVALAFWAITWAGLRGWLPVPISDPTVWLAPAALSLAVSAALGVAAFELDLPGYRFGWRQLSSAAAALAVALAALPVIAGAAGGRWHLPGQGPSAALVLPARTAGDYRVLWVGAPSALPLGSWRLSDGVGYATSLDGEPSVTDLWPPAQAGATSLLATDLRLAAAGDTSELGHLLAPLAVRFVVVPNHDAPSGSGARPVPVPGALLEGLGRQADLRALAPDPDYSVYLNAAWSPGVALFPAGALASATSGGP